MGREVWDEVTGERFYQDDSGALMPAPESSLLAQAGRQMADIGSGIQSAAGRALDNPAWINAAEQDTAARNAAFAGTDQASPIQSMVGQAIPSIATAPITGGASVLGQMAANVGIGAAESALDLGEGGTFGSRALAGAAGGVLGDIGGRAMGRIANTAKGLYDDILRARPAPANPAAATFEALGGRTLAHQRMEQGTDAQRLAQRMAQGAEVAGNAPRTMTDVAQANDALFRDRLVEAVGLDPGAYDNLGNQFKSDALDHFNSGFSQVAREASTAGEIALDSTTATKLASIPEIKELIGLGEFQGLADGGNTITGEQWMTAREALTEAAATRFANGKSPAGKILFGMVDELDADIGRHVPDEFLSDYARLREQYRVFSIAERPNAISSDGQVNVRTLRKALDSRSQGFGRTATGGGETVNAESRALIDTMQAADNPEFKAFKSSGTAENQALENMADDAVRATTDMMAGDPRSTLGMIGKLQAPSVIAASNMGGGRMFEGAKTPNIPLRTAGGVAGRGALDELFYPFIGRDDDRPQQ